jgi:hypothetical protein
MSQKSTDCPLFERPPEIELIRSMARGTQLTARQRKLLEKQEASAITADEAFIIKKADDWLYLPPGETAAGEMLFGGLWFKANCASFLPIPMWGNPSWRCS